MYADDLKIYQTITCKSDQESLRQNIDKVVAWSSSNHLPINIGKTKHITFSRKSEILSFNYSINNRAISSVDLVEDLGVKIDNRLYFTEHIKNIVSRARRNLGLVLWLSRKFRSVTTCTLLFTSLVRSQLEYAVVVWNSNRAFTANLIEGVQNRFINWIRYKFSDFGGFSKSDVRIQLNISLLSTRRSIFDMLHFHRNLHGKLPICVPVGIRPHRITRAPRSFVTSLGTTISPIERCSTMAVKLELSLDFWSEEDKFKKDLIEALNREPFP